MGEETRRTEQSLLYQPRYQDNHMEDAPVNIYLTTWVSYHDTIQWETLTNPHFNSFDELVDIAKHIQLVWGTLIG